jgi:LytS/YehU family sensor histidine kinase
MRDRDERTPAAASAEVRALQSRMNPHFLFNALNTLAALADDRTARNSPCGRMVASNS